MTTYVQCRECSVIYDVDLRATGTCECGSTAVDPLPVKTACQTCNGNGVLFLIPAEPLDTGLDWVQCPDCHGKGHE